MSIISNNKSLSGQSLDFVQMLGDKGISLKLIKRFGEQGENYRELLPVLYTAMREQDKIGDIKGSLRRKIYSLQTREGKGIERIGPIKQVLEILQYHRDILNHEF